VLEDSRILKASVKEGKRDAEAGREEAKAANPRLFLSLSLFFLVKKML